MLRAGDASGSLPDPPGDFGRFFLMSFFAFVSDCERRELALPVSADADPENDSRSSSKDVAAVMVEPREREDMRETLLSAVTVDWVYVDDRLATVFDRLCVLIDPPKMVSFDDPARAWKRFREMASKPNMPARVRLTVGVEGAD